MSVKDDRWQVCGGKGEAGRQAKCAGCKASRHSGQAWVGCVMGRKVKRRGGRGQGRKCEASSSHCHHNVCPVHAAPRGGVGGGVLVCLSQGRGKKATTSYKGTRQHKEGSCLLLSLSSLKNLSPVPLSPTAGFWEDTEQKVGRHKIRIQAAQNWRMKCPSLPCLPAASPGKCLPKSTKCKHK